MYDKYFYNGVFFGNMSYNQLFRLNFTLHLLINQLDLNMSAKELYNAEKLDLSNKNVPVPKELNILPNLRYLNLSQEQLSNLPRQVDQMNLIYNKI